MNDPNRVAPPPPPGEPPSGGPPPPQEPPSATPAGNAWERRGELGFVQGLVAGCKDFIFTPSEAWRQTLRSGDVASPLLFAVLIAVVAGMIGQLWATLIGASFLSMMPAEMQEGLGVLMVSSGAGFIASIFIIPVVTVIGVFIWSAILHVMLMLLGALDGSEAGFEGSLRVVCYSSIGFIAKVVPVIGQPIAYIWIVVLMVLGVTRLHGTTEGKAVAAVLLPLAICCVCLIGAVMLGGIGAVMSGLAE